mmetsp:Transcript_26729/g.48453  ORF Transcript_26729/g.48453 Transcript_26729/m.48453 type:complete len:83 (+) Transcript_26729:367-615(+)
MKSQFTWNFLDFLDEPHFWETASKALKALHYSISSRKKETNVQPIAQPNIRRDADFALEAFFRAGVEKMERDEERVFHFGLR